MKLDNMVGQKYDELFKELAQISSSIPDAKELTALQSIRENLDAQNSKLTELKQLISQLESGTFKDAQNMNYRTLQWRAGTIPAMIQKRGQEIRGHEATTLSEFKGSVLKTNQKKESSSSVQKEYTP